MESINWLRRLAPQERVSVALFLSLLILGSGIMVGRFWGSQQVIVAEPRANSAPAVSEAEKIFVHVAGQVKKPGVYQLPDSARVFQAIEQAGGAGEKADLDFLNLAQPVADGSKIYVPAKGERPAAEKAVSPPEKQRSGKQPQKLEGPVNLNAATSEQLQLLPGVGPALAARIIAHRQKLGGFASLEQLLDVSGIGAKTLAKLREQLTL